MNGSNLDHVRDLYAELNSRIDASTASGFTRFLNYGYRPIEDEPPVGPKIAAFAPGRDSLQLLFQLIRDVDSGWSSVLEVGSGRGGNLWALNRFLNVESTIGIDLSRPGLSNAKSSGSPGTFVEGDAAALPFRTRSVGLVLTLESSCHYPDLDRYLREVARVVAHDGQFLYGDILPTPVARQIPDALERLGFRVLSARDVTRNVLAARAERGSNAQALLDGGRSAPSAPDWVGGPDSHAYRGMAQGSLQYFLIQARRSRTAPTTASLFDPSTRAQIAEGAATVARALDFS